MNLLTTRQRRPDAKTERLAALPPFRNCTTRELHTIASLVDQSTFRAGEVIVREEHPAAQGFLLLSGRVGTTLREQPQGEAGAGASVGVVALLHEGFYTRTVIALEDVEVFVLTSRVLTALLLELPLVARPLLASLLRGDVS